MEDHKIKAKSQTEEQSKADANLEVDEQPAKAKAKAKDANKPGPRNTDVALSWFLERIVSAQGWTILFAKHQSTIFLNDYACPGKGVYLVYYL